jgi:hypothetical protein
MTRVDRDVAGSAFSRRGKPASSMRRSSTPRATSSPAPGDASNPAVVWNRASLSFLVAWQSAGDIAMRRFAANGVAIDAASQIISGSQPALTPFGSLTAAAYRREADEPQYGGVGRIFIRLAGTTSRVRTVR